jgi:hypothetical protein
MDSLLERQYRLEDLMPLIREQLAEGKSVRFSPRGISMLPMLRQGIDSVVLSPLPDRLKKYDLPLYQRPGGQFVLHRIVEVGDTYTCLGDNQFDKEPGRTQEQMIALFTAFYRGGKRHSVTEPGYWLYCRVWYHSRHIRRFCRRAIGWIGRHLK